MTSRQLPFREMHNSLPQWYVDKVQYVTPEYSQYFAPRYVRDQCPEVDSYQENRRSKKMCPRRA